MLYTSAAEVVLIHSLDECSDVFMQYTIVELFCNARKQSSAFEGIPTADSNTILILIPFCWKIIPPFEDGLEISTNLSHDQPLLVLL